MQARLTSPIQLLPELFNPIIAASQTRFDDAGVPQRILELAHLRASQINGCAYCCDMHSRSLKHGGANDEMLWAVAAWRESGEFNDAERAALALTEAATRIADQPEAVSDEIWNAAKAHFSEKGLALLIAHIALINFYNRLNVVIQQPVAKHAQAKTPEHA
jgi:AhpD family alkylhydroperoxidase